MYQILSLVTFTAKMQGYYFPCFKAEVKGICLRAQNHYVALRFQTFTLDIGDKPLILLFVKLHWYSCLFLCL